MGRGWRLEGSSCWSSREEDAGLLTPALVLHSQVLPVASITPKTHLPFKSHHLITTSEPFSFLLSKAK